MNNISLKNNNIELNDILEVVNSLSSGKEEQEKSIEITENGTQSIIPDKGKTLSKVNITTNIESGEENIDFLELKKTLSSYVNNTVSNIYNYAFQHCSSLTSVSLPVCSSLGNYAFANCSSLTSVDLPVCSSLGQYTFAECSSLISVDLPMCNWITPNAFRSCVSLTSINLPRCSSIGDFGFINCASLTSIDLLVCNNIDICAFMDCRLLESMILRHSSVVKLAGTNAFSFTPMSISTLTGSFGSIYVPASLVDAYKSATNWTAYADRITAIVE